MTDPFSSNMEVVVYALALLGGVTKKVSTEDIAIKAFEIAPDRFSWILAKHSEYPDKLVAKTALEDAAKKRNGNYVIGRYARDTSKDGWTLTPDGITWINSNKKRIEVNIVKQENTPSLRPTDMKRFLSKVQSSAAYKQYIETGSIGEVSVYLILDLLQASPDAPKDIFKAKINRLKKIGQLSKDKEIIKFLTACENKLFHEIK